MRWRGPCRWFLEFFSVVTVHDATCNVQNQCSSSFADTPVTATPSQNSSLTCQNYKGDDSLVDLFNLFSLYGSGLLFVFPGSGWIWLLQMWCGIPQTQAGQSRHGVVSFLHGSREHVYLHIICHVSSQLPSCKHFPSFPSQSSVQHPLHTECLYRMIWPAINLKA